MVVAMRLRRLAAVGMSHVSETNPKLTRLSKDDIVRLLKEKDSFSNQITTQVSVL